MPIAILFDKLPDEEKLWYQNAPEEVRKKFREENDIDIIGDPFAKATPTMQSVISPLRPPSDPKMSDPITLESALKAGNKALQYGYSGGAGGALWGLGNPAMAIGGAVGGALLSPFMPDTNTPAGVTAHLANIAAPGIGKLGGGVLGQAAATMGLNRVIPEVERGITSMWPGAEPSPPRKLSDYMPNTGDAFAAVLGALPPFWQRVHASYSQAAPEAKKAALLAMQEAAKAGDQNAAKTLKAIVSPQAQQDFRSFMSGADLPGQERAGIVTGIDEALKKRAPKAAAPMAEAETETERQLRMSIEQQQGIQKPLEQMTTEELDTIYKAKSIANDSLLGQRFKTLEDKNNFLKMLEDARASGDKEAEKMILSFAPKEWLEGNEELERIRALQAKAAKASKAEPADDLAQSSYGLDTRRVIREMRKAGPNTYVRDLVQDPKQMKDLPLVLDAADEAGIPRVRELARVHMIDGILSGTGDFTDAAAAKKTLDRIGEFGSSKFGDKTGRDIFNEVFDSEHAYNNMTKIREAVDITLENERAAAAAAKEAAKGKGPVVEPKADTAKAWYEGPGAKMAAKVGIGATVGTMLHLAIPAVPATLATEAIAAAAGAAIAMAAPKMYRVISLTPEALASILPRSRTALFDSLLDAVEGGSKISRNTLAAHLAKLKPYLSSDRVMSAAEVEALMEKTRKQIEENE